MNPKILLAVMLMGITSPALAASGDWSVGIIFLLVVAFIIYMLPTWIAFKRKNPMMDDIMLLNLFFGWTVLIWALLFLWAALSQDKKEPNKPCGSDGDSPSNVINRFTYPTVTAPSVRPRKNQPDKASESD